jgi:hypothetical protein
LLLDEGCAFPRKDRLSFPRLVGLGRDGRVLEATPVWRLWEEMGTGQGEQPALCSLRCGADRSGLSGDGRRVHDATLVPAPRERRSEEEKAAIKQGQIPERGKEKPAKLRQKDRDARFKGKSSKARVGEGEGGGQRGVC